MTEKFFLELGPKVEESGESVVMAENGTTPFTRPGSDESNKSFGNWWIVMIDSVPKEKHEAFLLPASSPIPVWKLLENSKLPELFISRDPNVSSFIYWFIEWWLAWHEKSDLN